jgi:hypothetical protein
MIKEVIQEEQKQFDRIYITIQEPKSWLRVDNVIKKTDNDIDNYCIFSIPYSNRGIKYIGNNLYQFTNMYDVPKMITMHIDPDTIILGTENDKDLRITNGQIVSIRHVV